MRQLYRVETTKPPYSGLGPDIPFLRVAHIKAGPTICIHFNNLLVIFPS